MPYCNDNVSFLHRLEKPANVAQLLQSTLLNVPGPGYAEACEVYNDFAKQAMATIKNLAPETLKQPLQPVRCALLASIHAVTKGWSLILCLVPVWLQRDTARVDGVGAQFAGATPLATGTGTPPGLGATRD